MTGRRQDAGRGGRDVPLRLLPPVLLPLDADQERQAVDTLAGMLAGLLGRPTASEAPSGDGGGLRLLDVPDDDEAA